MATAAIVLKTTKKLLNNEYAVALRLTHERESKYITISALVTNQSLPFRCRVEDWKQAQAEDGGLGKFRRSFSTYKECNAVLESKLLQAKKILERYEKENIPYSFKQFEADLKGKTQCLLTTLSEYYDLQIAVLEKQGREGTAGLYRENKSILSMFNPSASIIDVNFKFLESFEYWMRNERGNKDTTISVKMRNLQRVINQAIEDKLFKQENYPFGEKKYSINKRLDHKTKKLAIKTEKISKLKALQLEPGSSLHFAQQIFMFSYYSRGMNFIDMTFLKWAQIGESYTDYKRRKTGGQFSIPRNPYIDEILSYFRESHNSKDGYVFPIIDTSIHITRKQQYTRKKTALKAVNDNLKKLAKMIDEPTLKLTTNVGRHSYATGLKRSGANTGYITEALGHATQEQTETYLAEFEKGVIESWENKMFGL